MSSPIPIALYPIVVCQDRYDGTYSGGAWWAVAQADLQLDDINRVTWLWEHGPGSCDVDAAIFWSKHPPWIAAGQSPQEAINALVLNDRSDSDDWVRQRIEEDPRYRPSLFPQRNSTG